tara:strand:+ start:397 stop:861 length:465 start_codon:yes stop_codon:yes gene_type:complete
MSDKILNQYRNRSQPSLKRKLVVAGLALSSVASVYGGYKLFNDEPKDLVEVDGRLMAGPASANELIRYGISVIEENSVGYDEDTYLEMFKIIRGKAEENPEIMDYFGPRAKEYLVYGSQDDVKREEAYDYSREKVDELRSFARQRLGDLRDMLE